jgi:rhamnogalacturonan endolyase
MQVLRHIKILLIAGSLSLLASACVPEDRIFFTDDFRKPFDTSVWVAEIAPFPNSSVYTMNGRLVLDTRGGVTVWLKRKLNDNVIIEFDRRVLVAGGANDRLSDLNMFWMASDPGSRDLFTRTGIFEQYGSLSLYYAGIGGNHNTTTRFRKYHGDGTREVLMEYTDEGHLLKPAHDYHIRIEAINGTTSLWVDDTCWFRFPDPAPLREGYFGFRSTWSRQEISNFRVLYRRSSPAEKLR